MVSCRYFCLLVSLALLLMFSPVLAVGTDSGLEITLDFKDVELTDMIGTISELTGKNFVYDESVRGKVSVVSPQPVSIDEAYRLFSTVLNIKGFTVIPAGGVNKIVSIRNAKEESLPLANGTNLGDQYTTRMIELKNLDAPSVVDTILRPLMPKTSHVVAHEPSNTIVLTDSDANIRRLANILSVLDRSWEEEQTVIVPLQYAEAQVAADLVLQILEGDSETQSKRKKTVSVHKKAAGQVIPYERTNKLILVGDSRFIEDAKTLIARLDVKATAGSSGIHVYYLENAEAEGLAETLNQIITGIKNKAPASKDKPAEKVFGEVAVTADKPTNALIVNATAKDYANIEALIRQLDIKRKQVFVEALILELSMGAMQDLGTTLQGAIDTGSDSVMFGMSNSTAGGLSSFAASNGVPSLLTEAVDGIMLGGLFNPITTVINGESVTIPALSALIGLSQNDSNVNVLSAPRLLTSDNEEAEIVVGKNIPVVTSRSSSTSDPGAVTSSVERQDAALILRFTPQITEGNMVRLKIHQEISDVIPTSDDSLGLTSQTTVQELGPTLKKTLLRNSIVAEDGKTVVLGGLFQTDKTTSTTKVPLLGDIPVLGHLFKRTKDSESKTSLLIFITPHVIRDSEDLERITQDNRSRLQSFRQEKAEEPSFSLPLFEASAGLKD